MMRVVKNFNIINNQIMALNKVLLLGNVGAEPKTHTLQDGSLCAQFSLATTERAYKLSNGTQVPERTEWHNIVAWRGIAGVVEKYVHKGSKLFIEGKLKTRKYTDKSGIERFTTEIHVDNLELLGSKTAGNTPPSVSIVQNDMQPVSHNIAPQSANPAPINDEGEYDEIPF